MMRYLRRYLLLIAVIIVSFIAAPMPAHAETEVGDLCPNPKGQYFQRLLPYFTHNQVALVNPKNLQAVQVLADNVQQMRFLDNSAAWSPSCRYFAFTIGLQDGNQTVMWDT